MPFIDATAITNDAEIAIPATNKGLKIYVIGGSVTYHEKVADGIYATRTLEAGIHESSAPANNDLVFKLTGLGGGVTASYRLV